MLVTIYAVTATHVGLHSNMVKFKLRQEVEERKALAGLHSNMVKFKLASCLP